MGRTPPCLSPTWVRVQASFQNLHGEGGHPATARDSGGGGAGGDPTKIGHFRKIFGVLRRKSYPDYPPPPEGGGIYPSTHPPRRGLLAHKKESDGVPPTTPPSLSTLGVRCAQHASHTAVMAASSAGGMPSSRSSDRARATTEKYGNAYASH